MNKKTKLETSILKRCSIHKKLPESIARTDNIDDQL